MHKHTYMLDSHESRHEEGTGSFDALQDTSIFFPFLFLQILKSIIRRGHYDINLIRTKNLSWHSWSMLGRCGFWERAVEDIDLWLVEQVSFLYRAPFLAWNGIDSWEIDLSDISWACQLIYWPHYLDNIIIYLSDPRLFCLKIPFGNWEVARDLSVV